MHRYHRFYEKAFIILAGILLTGINSFCQQGKDGAKVISTPSIINAFTFLTQDAAKGTSNLIVDNSILNDGRFTSNLSPGDLLMIIQMQGATIRKSNDKNYGQILSYGSSGLYEFAEVLSVPDAKKITLLCNLKNDYRASGKVQIVRVPRYASLTVADSLKTDYWNGKTGGIIAIESQGIVQIDATINVSEKGFRGGSLLNDNVSSEPVAFADYYSSSALDGGEKGESIAGYQSDYDRFGGRYSMGAPANGGGGGNSHNAGGGGGANGGDTSKWTGNGNPDLSVAGWATAWNKETNSFSNSISSGGGRGGCSFAYSQSGVSALDYGPGDSFWGGDLRRNVGGKGGRPLDNSTGRIFFGGGGGAADANNDAGGRGGNGGGLVFINACSSITGLGKILANGEQGKDAKANGGNDAAGGGGAGGTIILNSLGVISSNLSLQTNGANGGNQFITGHIGEAEGPGGGGGGGVILLSDNNPSYSLNGGVNGSTNSNILTDFTPNGSTKGGSGFRGNVIISTYNLSVSDTIMCPGKAVLKATLNANSFYGESIVWYDSPTGGKIRSLGSTFFTPELDQDTTYYIQNTCPDLCNLQPNRLPLKVFIQPIISDAGISQYTCSGNTVQLGVPATKAYHYQWTPKGVSNDTLPNPSLLTTNKTDTNLVKTFFVSTSKKGCKPSVDSVQITIYPLPKAEAGSNENICMTGTKTLGAPAKTGNTYEWQPTNYLDKTDTSSPTFTYTNPPTEVVNLKYYLTVKNANCNSKDSVAISIYPEIKTDTTGHIIEACKSDSLKLTASGGIKYQWNNNVQTAANIVLPEITTFYTVDIFNGACSVSDTFFIKVKNNPPAEIFIPNAFSPNGDSNNEIFQAYCEFAKDFKGTIFNRWGESVFTWADINSGWDGKVKGKMSLDEIFIYYIEMKKECEMEPTRLRGTVTLIK